MNLRRGRANCTSPIQLAIEVMRWTSSSQGIGVPRDRVPPSSLAFGDDQFDVSRAKNTDERGVLGFPRF